MIRLLMLSLCALLSCGKSDKNTLKVIATPVPHAQMLEFIKPDLEKQGISLEVIEVDDYNIPNRALANREADANFFQHIPFLEAQIASFHYPLAILAKIHIEPMGIYSKKIRHLSELKDRAVISLPNDPTNEARALFLLHKEGLIQLDNLSNLQATVVNITSNPKQLQFQEIDAAMLPRTLDDVDAAVINTNFALQAGLNPLKDALALEDKTSPYVNIIAIRTDEEGRADLEALKIAMTSEKMRAFILEKYKGAIIPAF